MSYQYVNNQLIKQDKKSGHEDLVSSTVKKRQSMGEPTEEWLEERESYINTFKQEMDISGKQMEAEREKLNVLLTCLEISRRIAGGDKVPPADHKYLMEHDSGLYFRSISMRFPKNNPNEYKQLSEDDKERQDLPVLVENEPQCQNALIKSEFSAQEASTLTLDINV